MTYELKLQEYFGKTGQMLKSVLEKDRGRLELRLKQAVEKAAQEYMIGISIALVEKFEAEKFTPEMTLTITTPD